MKKKNCMSTPTSKNSHTGTIQSSEKFTESKSITALPWTKIKENSIHENPGPPRPTNIPNKPQKTKLLPQIFLGRLLALETLGPKKLD